MVNAANKNVDVLTKQCAGTGVDFNLLNKRTVKDVSCKSCSILPDVLNTLKPSIRIIGTSV